MRTITLGAINWSEVEGAYAVIPVLVDWPELRLTEEQVLANAIAHANGEDTPFPDPSYIEVRIRRHVCGMTA